MATKKPKVMGMSYGGHAFISGDKPSPDPAPAETAGVSSEAEQEARAVIAVLEALQGLRPDAVERVLRVVVEEYNESRG